jgi:hypothetical protein
MDFVEVFFEVVADVVSGDEASVSLMARITDTV